MNDTLTPTEILFAGVRDLLVADGWTDWGDGRVTLGDAEFYQDLWEGFVALEFDGGISGHLDVEPQRRTEPQAWVDEIRIEVERWETGACHECGRDGPLHSGTANVISDGPGLAGRCDECRAEAAWQARLDPRDIAKRDGGPRTPVLAATPEAWPDGSLRRVHVEPPASGMSVGRCECGAADLEPCVSVR